MRFKKYSMVVLSIMILLVFVASASAADVNDTDVISIDDSANKVDEKLALDSNQDDVVSNDNDALENDDESLAAGTDSEILGDDVGNFSQLAAEISQSGPVILKHKTYVYDSGSDIDIRENGKVIDGNGAVIDMLGADNTAFYVIASGVTIKNLTIKNLKHFHNGAISFESPGNVINCNFVNNTAISYDGGALWMHSGNVINCTFTNNSANKGGALYIEWGGNVTNCNFVDNYAVSGLGGAANLNMVNVTNCNFTNNRSPDDGGAFSMQYGRVENCSFSRNRGDRGGALFLSGRGTVMNCNFTNNFATMAAAWVYSGTVKNCNFTNNKGGRNGGGLWMRDGAVENSKFTNNSAIEGGAVCFDDNGRVTNCNFINNSAEGGGAVKMAKGEVTNSNFRHNTAAFGSAIRFSEIDADDRISNCVFLDNRADMVGDTPFKVVKNINHTEIILEVRNNYINAISSSSVIKFSNVTYWGVGGIVNTDSSAPIRSYNPPGQNVTVCGVVNGNIINTTKVSDENGKIVLDDAGDYWLVVRHDGDSYYTRAEKILTNMELTANVTSFTTNNKTVNITAKSNIFNGGMPGKLLFILANGLNITASYAGNGTWWAVHTFDDYDVYQVNASYIGIDNVKTNNGTINITKADSTITLEDIVLTYGESVNATVKTEGATGITAKIGDVEVIVDKYIIPISGLSGGNYTLTVTTIPDADHNAVSKAVNLTVNKMHTEIILTNESIDLKPYVMVGDLASLNPSNAGILTFASSNGTVALVYSDGKIWSQDKGTAIITVSYAGNENYTASERKITVNVSPYDVSLIVKNTTVNMEVGGRFDIGATTDPTGAVIDYVSSNASVASVTSYGAIMAGEEGTAIITVSIGNGRTISFNSTNITVTVSKKPTEIILVNETLDLKALDTVSDFARITTGYPKDLKFVSSNEDVAVIENDMIVAVGAGKANITVYYEGNNVYAAAENRTIQVTVTAIDAEINVTKRYYELYGGEQDEIIVFTAPDDLKVKFETIDDDVVFVYNGKITALGEGNANIFISLVDNTVYKADVIYVKVKVIKMPTQIVSSAVSTVYNRDDNLTIDLKDIKGNPIKNANVTVDLNGAKNYTTDENGTIKVPTNVLSAGEYQVNITFAGNDGYARANATVNVVVAKDTGILAAVDVKTTYNVNKNLVISLKDSKGNALKGFEIAVDLNGVKTYTTNANGQVIINVAKLVPKTYDAKITFKGNGNYLNSEKSVKVTVKKAVSKIAAKKKTFKSNKKVKKYVITLKSGKNPIKKVEVTIKIGKKTFKAKTNAKGKATFKIKKLTKKGKYAATIKFKGNAYYLKSSKKVKITIK